LRNELEPIKYLASVRHASRLGSHWQRPVEDFANSNVGSVDGVGKPCLAYA
jgi:hypothetical protein